MKLAKLERLLKARTTYDLLTVTSPDAARYLRLATAALLPPAEREHVMGTRGGPARLARAFLDAQGETPQARALAAYRAAWGEV